MLSANILQVLPAWQALFQEPELPRKPDSQVPVGHRDRGTNTSLTPTRHAERQHLTQPKCYLGGFLEEASGRCYLGGFLEEASGGSAVQAPWSVLTAWRRAPEILLSATPGRSSSDFRRFFGAACSLRIKRPCQRISVHKCTERGAAQPCPEDSVRAAGAPPLHAGGPES